MLAELLEAFPQIREPSSSTRLVPPGSLFLELMRPFAGDYFLYWGALASRPALWLVSREPIGIAQEQVSVHGILEVVLGG